MICPNCQRENNSEASFCAFCGQYLAAGAAASPVVPPLPPVPTRPTAPAPSPVAAPAAPPPPIMVFACRVCGQQYAPPARLCPRCGTPPGMRVNPEDPTGSSFLPFDAPYPA